MFAVASNEHNSVRFYSLEQEVPKLSDLCRNFIRKRVRQNGIEELTSVPKPTRNYLSYDRLSLCSHYENNFSLMF